MIRRRLANHGLDRPRFERAEDVVQWFGAVQAQDYPAAKWAVAQRTTGLTDRDIDRSFNDGAILRTHVLRPTWHFVTPADIRWMVALTAPRILKACAHPFRQMGLTATRFVRSNNVIAEALRGGGQLTRVELAQVLRESDKRTVTYLLMRAEVDGVVCSGALRGKQHTYALFDERVPAAPALARSEALAALARRYFVSRGPATVQDFAWWSGLTVADARAAHAMVVAEVGDDHEPAAARRPRAHLLPNYDEYVVAYADRSALLDASQKALLFRHTIAIDGRVVGTWTRKLTTRAVTVATKLFRRLTKVEAAALDQAVDRYRAFHAVGPSPAPPGSSAP